MKTTFTQRIVIVLVLILFGSIASKGIACRIDSVYYYDYFYDSQADTNLKVLSQIRIYSYASDGLSSTQIDQLWDRTNHVWVNSDKNDYTYNASHQVLSWTEEHWFNKTWAVGYLTEYTYDVNGYLTQKLRRYSDNPWVNSEYDLYSNNANGQDTLHVHQTWNTAINVWDNYYNTSSSFFPNGNLQERINQTWNAKTKVWTNYIKFNNYIDVTGLISQYTFQVWDTSSLTWLNFRKSDYTYTATGHLSTSITQEWDSTAHKWVNYEKTDSTYNNSDAPTNSITTVWDKTRNSWINIDRAGFDYTTNGCLQFENYYVKDSLRMWRLQYQAEYFESGDNNGVESPVLQAVSCFPNPASSSITIVTDLSEKETMLTIYNSLGQQMQEGVIERNTNSKQLDVTQLPAGIYTIMLGNRQARFVKQ